jgi:hypothetical protein
MKNTKLLSIRSTVVENELQVFYVQNTKYNMYLRAYKILIDIILWNYLHVESDKASSKREISHLSHIWNLGQ